MAAMWLAASHIFLYLPKIYDFLKKLTVLVRLVRMCHNIPALGKLCLISPPQIKMLISDSAYLTV